TDESTDVVGLVTKDSAAELGLHSGIPVSAGSSDQPAQAVGNGLIDPPLGSMLSAGMALKWFRAILGNERFSYAELDRRAAEVPPGCNGLTFLPYIVGERSPIMDPRARGGIVGLTLGHGPGHLARALLEGDAFAMRQIIETMEECGASLPQLVASGNGLGSPLW